MITLLIATVGCGIQWLQPSFVHQPQTLFENRLKHWFDHVPPQRIGEAKALVCTTSNAKLSESTWITFIETELISRSHGLTVNLRLAQIRNGDFLHRVCSHPTVPDPPAIKPLVKTTYSLTSKGHFNVETVSCFTVSVNCCWSRVYTLLTGRNKLMVLLINSRCLNWGRKAPFCLRFLSVM